eukprot:1987969-Prymnesium_polylepis.1
MPSRHGRRTRRSLLRGLRSGTPQDPPLCAAAQHRVAARPGVGGRAHQHIGVAWRRRRTSRCAGSHAADDRQRVAGCAWRRAEPARHRAARPGAAGGRRDAGRSGRNRGGFCRCGAPIGVGTEGCIVTVPRALCSVLGVGGPLRVLLLRYVNMLL